MHGGDPAAEGAAAPAGVAHVLVEIGQRRVAVLLEALLEVADLNEVTPLPLAPGWLWGVTNMRGVAVPVVDLATLLGWEGARSGHRALVLRDGRFAMAVPVSTVHAVRWFDLEPVDESATTAIVTHDITVDDQPTSVVSAHTLLAHVRRGEHVGVTRR
jgi:chemotaxis signal transduction protein